VFSLIVDESRDASCKEQMEMASRYVDSFGDSKGSFFGLVHVKKQLLRTSRLQLILYLKSIGQLQSS
jgi:hypothetical protein